MSTFPGSTRLLKGDVIGLDRVNLLASVVIFQYNPNTLTAYCGCREYTED